MRAGFFHLVLVSAVVMGMSHTIAKERIFAPLRARLGGTEKWFGYLVSCAYCASHWLAFGLVPLTNAYGIRIPWDLGRATVIVEWFLSSILVTVIAAFLRVAFYFVDETQGLVRKRKEVVAEEKERIAEDLHVTH